MCSRFRLRSGGWGLFVAGRLGSTGSGASLLESFHGRLNRLECAQELVPDLTGRRRFGIIQQRSHAFHYRGGAFLEAGNLFFPGELAFGTLEQAGQISNICASVARALEFCVDNLQVLIKRQDQFLTAFDVFDDHIEFSNDLLLQNRVLLLVLKLLQRGHEFYSPALKSVHGCVGRLFRMLAIQSNCGWASKYCWASNARPQAEPHRAEKLIALAIFASTTFPSTVPEVP